MGNCWSRQPAGRGARQGETVVAGAQEVEEELKSPTGVTITNRTADTIVLRDREREVYGTIRRHVDAGDEQTIPVDLKEAGTYYRMAVLVSNSSGLRPTNPPLFIDTEDLHANKRIAISCSNGRHHLNKESKD